MSPATNCKHDLYRNHYSPGGMSGIPRPAATPFPGPAIKPLPSSSLLGGGPSTLIDTTVSPLTMTKPNVRFCSTSGAGSAGSAPFAFLP